MSFRQVSRLHAPLFYTKYIAPFELVHTNLWGPSPNISYSGFSYYIYFVDVFTKYTSDVFFLKQKYDALHAFK